MSINNPNVVDLRDFYLDVGTGDVDQDMDAFGKASAQLQAAGGGILNIPPLATLLVGRQKLTGASAQNQLWSWAPDPIIRIVGAAKPVIINGNGATLKCVGGLRYGSFNGTTGDKLATNNPFFGDHGERATPYEGMVHLIGCSGGITIRDLKLDGNSSKLIVGGKYGDQGYQIPAAGLLLENTSGPLLIENVDSDNHAFDGMLLNHLAERGIETIPGVVRNFRARYNARQGLSLTGGRGIHFTGIVLNHTGKLVNADLATPLASAPTAGVDIEAEGPGRVVRDCTFENFEIFDNAGAGILHSVNDGADIDFRNGRVIGATQVAMFGGLPGFRFHNIKFVGQVVNGYNDPAGLRAQQFVDCSFTDDPTQSPSGKVYGGAYIVQDPGVGSRFTRCAFRVLNGSRLPATEESFYEDCTFHRIGAGTQPEFLRGHFSGRNDIRYPEGVWFFGPYNDDLGGKGSARGVLTINGKNYKRATYPEGGGFTIGANSTVQSQPLPFPGLRPGDRIGLGVDADLGVLQARAIYVSPGTYRVAISNPANVVSGPVPACTFSIEAEER